jgi:sulfur carrier protein
MLGFSLNGQAHQCAPGTTIATLLEQHGLSEKRVAVECNGRIVSKSLHSQTLVHADDAIEIVQAIGGG